VDWGFIISTTLLAAFGIEAIVFGLAAIGLNLQFGYTGLLNFGQSAFLAVAAYSLAVLVAQMGFSFWVGILVGLLMAVLLALLLGIPTLRLRADYLAIVTIAAAEIIRLLLRSVTLKDWFGGSDGLNDFASGFYDLNPISGGPYSIGPLTLTANQIFIIVVGWLLVALALLIVWLLVRSPWGRVLKGIREDEDAVRSLGKNVYLYKMQALIIGGVLGSLGGFVYALGRQNVQPDFFGTDSTFFAYAILILGGAARVFGPVLGAVIFWALIQGSDVILRSLIDVGFPVVSLMTGSQAAIVRFILVGLGLMLLMIFRPQGILGDRKELALDAR
jgi:branched-chain amino acid transport system permease protein